MMFVSFLKSKGKSKNSSVEPCCCQRSLHYEARQETSHPKYMPSVSHKVSGLKHPQTKVETSSYTHHIPLLSLLTFQVMIGLSSWKPLKIQIWWARGAMGLNLAGTGCESAIPTALVSRHPRSTDPKTDSINETILDWLKPINQSFNQSVNQSMRDWKTKWTCSQEIWRREKIKTWNIITNIRLIIYIYVHIRSRDTRQHEIT